MLTSQSTSQNVWASGPVAQALPGANLAEFVRTNLDFDMRAVRIAAWRAFKAQGDFLARWSVPAVRRRWHRAILRRALNDAWSEAIDQHHNIIDARVRQQGDLLTADERVHFDRLGELMQTCPLGWQGSQDFNRYGAERSAISKAAYERAYLAVIDEAQGRASSRRAA